MRLVHYRYKPEFAATAGIEAAAPETGKDLAAGSWHLVTPPLSLSSGNSASKNPFPRLTEPRPWDSWPSGRRALSPGAPCTLTLEVWHLWSRDPCSSVPWMNLSFILLDLCPLSLVVLTSENLPLPAPTPRNPTP